MRGLIFRPEEESPSPGGLSFPGSSEPRPGKQGSLLCLDSLRGPYPGGLHIPKFFGGGPRSILIFWGWPKSPGEPAASPGPNKPFGLLFRGGFSKSFANPNKISCWRFYKSDSPQHSPLFGSQKKIRKNGKSRAFFLKRGIDVKNRFPRGNERGFSPFLAIES